MKRLTRTLLAACVGVGTTLTMVPQTASATAEVGPGLAVQGDLKRQLAAVRAATAKFQRPAVATRNGYVATSTCVELPGTGGMGYHYVSPANIADGVLNIRRPEMLVYVRTPRGLRLGAVEYFQPDADQDLRTASDRPALFGRRFDGPMPGHDAAMPIHYDLHVWLYKHNPAGRFSTWNPSVTCPTDRNH